MGRKNIIVLATFAALALGAAVVWPALSFYSLTGRFSPIHKIETLKSPVGVIKLSSDGLHLSDGRTVPIPGLRSLPSDSEALTEATARGVEVSADGRIWGLVRVHHWCGNDPVREHIARVDLSNMLTFLGVGKPVAAIPNPEFLATETGGTFSEWGWQVGEFWEFQAWENSKSLNHEGHGGGTVNVTPP